MSEDAKPRLWWRCWLFVSSLIVPGLGQALNGEYRRGVFFLAAAVFCMILDNAAPFIWPVSPSLTLLLLIVANSTVLILAIWAAVNAFRRGRQAPTCLLPRRKRYSVYAAFLIFAHVPDALSLVGPSLKAYSIPSTSMLPGLVVGDNFFVIENDGKRHPPIRGDVMVFKLPCKYLQLEPQVAASMAANCDPSIDFIKRVIGLPGDHVQIKGGMLYLNGIALRREPTGNYLFSDFPDRHTDFLQFEETMPDGRHYAILKRQLSGEPLDDTEEFVVPSDHYFVLGDNRDNSADSRDHLSGIGYVPSELLVGKAAFIFASTEKSSLQKHSSWLPVVRWSRIATIIN